MVVEPAGARVDLVRLLQEEVLRASRRLRLEGRRLQDSEAPRPLRLKVVLVAQARLVSRRRVGLEVGGPRRRRSGQVEEKGTQVLARVGINLALPRRRLRLVRLPLVGLGAVVQGDLVEGG